MSTEKGPNFLEEIIAEDIKNGKHGGRVLTRFPPEPNGYLHIGHATSICLNFGLAKTFGGKTNLRFDDTNPVTEKTEYVNSQQEDIQWLGFQWMWNNNVRFNGAGAGQFLYVIAGLHAVHVIGGIIALIIIVIKAFFGKIKNYNSVPVDIMKTYWHFVDLLWLYLLVFFIWLG